MLCRVFLSKWPLLFKLTNVCGWFLSQTLVVVFVFGVAGNSCYFIPEIRYLYPPPPPPYLVSLAKCLLIFVNIFKELSAFKIAFLYRFLCFQF